MLAEKDYEAVVKTVYGEARGEGFLGMLGVAYVIKNRVDSAVSWWGTDYYGVCHARLQFSCWNKDDHNSALLSALKMSSPALDSAKRAVDAMVSGSFSDPTKGAHLYHTIQRPAWARTWPPAWANKARFTTIVGNHRFYKEPGA